MEKSQIREQSATRQSCSPATSVHGCHLSRNSECHAGEGSCPLTAPSVAVVQVRQEERRVGYIWQVRDGGYEQAMEERESVVVQR